MTDGLHAGVVTERKYQSSIARLRDLAPVFTNRQVCQLLDVRPEIAKVYIRRWERGGLTSPAGDRAGIHYNLLRAPGGSETLLHDAVRIAAPGAVRAGASVLGQEGWTTQLSHILEVVAPVNSRHRGFPGIYRAIIHPRSREWFVLAAPGIKLGTKPGEAPSLTPAFALADALSDSIKGSDAAWRVDPDDLCEDVLQENGPAIAFAFSRFGIADSDEAREILDLARASPLPAPG